MTEGKLALKGGETRSYGLSRRLKKTIRWTIGATFGVAVCSAMIASTIYISKSTSSYKRECDGIRMNIVLSESLRADDSLVGKINRFLYKDCFTGEDGVHNIESYPHFRGQSF